jgi:ER lumen protein retaining receptor
MKILFLVTAYATLYLIQFKFQTSYRQHAAHDNFRILFLIVPSIIISIFLNLDNFMFFEVSLFFPPLFFFFFFLFFFLFSSFLFSIFTIMSKVVWTFSICLEAVAILPQLFLLRRCSKIDVLTADYVFMLGEYLGFFLSSSFESTLFHITFLHLLPKIRSQSLGIF